MASRRLFQCDAENCNTAHATEDDAFKHAIKAHYYLLQRYPTGYPCFVDECKRKFPSPSALERHYTTKHPPPDPKVFPLPDLFPTKDPMFPIRASLLYHVCHDPPSDPQTPTRPPGTCPCCSFPSFPSDTALARHVYKYHPNDPVALETVAHIPAASCQTCPPALYTGKPPVLFSLAGVLRHYAAEHKGLKVKLDETKPLLRPVGVRDGLLRLREQRQRWARRAGRGSGGEEETGGKVLWENGNECVFEGVGQGELGVSAMMPVRKARAPPKEEREEDHYWQGPWKDHL
jgi:hypothetical protein